MFRAKVFFQRLHRLWNQPAMESFGMVWKNPDYDIIRYKGPSETLEPGNCHLRKLGPDRIWATNQGGRRKISLLTIFFPRR